MNSSLQRFCASRQRLIHRSKNIERHVLVMPSGAELFLGMRESTQKTPDGRNDGVSFNAGIKMMKRGGRVVSARQRTRDFQFTHADLRVYKDEVWHGR